MSFLANQPNEILFFDYLYFNNHGERRTLFGAMSHSHSSKTSKYMGVHSTTPIEPFLLLKLLLIQTKKGKERIASLRQEFLVTPTSEVEPELLLH